MCASSPSRRAWREGGGQRSRVHAEQSRPRHASYWRRGRGVPWCSTGTSRRAQALTLTLTNPSPNPEPKPSPYLVTFSPNPNPNPTPDAQTVNGNAGFMRVTASLADSRSRLGVHGSRSGSGFSGARASRSRSARAGARCTPWLAPALAVRLLPLAHLSRSSRTSPLSLSRHALCALSFPFHTT